MLPMVCTINTKKVTAQTSLTLEPLTGSVTQGRRPGIGVVMGKEPVNLYSCYVELELQRFEGVRCVGPCSSLWLPLGLRGLIGPCHAGPHYSAAVPHSPLGYG